MKDPSADDNARGIPSESTSSSSSLFFGHLPVELKLRVFSFLTPLQLCRHVTLVCRSWYDLAHDPLLWMELDLSSWLDFAAPGANLAVCRLLKGTPLLRHLNLSGWNDLGYPEVEKITSFLPELEEIDLGFCHNVDVQMLNCLARRCQKLKAVNLEGCRSPDGVTDDAIRILCENLPFTLSRLNVSHCPGLSDEFLLFFARNSMAVEALNADGIPWISDLSLSILYALHSTTLVDLRLDGEELTDLSVVGVGQSCFNLQVLDISFCDLLTDLSLEALRGLRRLRHLRLKRGTGFSTNGLKNLFRLVGDSRSTSRGGGAADDDKGEGSNGESNAKITMTNSTSPFPEMDCLMLPECSKLDNEGAMMLVRACGKTLTRLNLSWCWEIDDVGLQSLIHECPRINHMQLQGLKVLEGISFVQLLTAMPDIEYLGLEQCNRVDDTILARLVRSKPTLTIINYYGEKIAPEDSYVRYMADGGGVGSIRPDMLASPVRKQADEVESNASCDVKGFLAEEEEVEEDEDEEERIERASSSLDFRDELIDLVDLDTLGAPAPCGSRVSSVCKSDGCSDDYDSGAGSLCDKFRKMAWKEDFDEDNLEKVGERNSHPSEIDDLTNRHSALSSHCAAVGALSPEYFCRDTRTDEAVTGEEDGSVDVRTEKYEALLNEDISDFIERDLDDGSDDLALTEPWDWISI